MQIYQLFLKRFLDFSISLLLILLFFPFFLIIVALVLFYGKDKVLFLQKRPGLKQKIFYLIKLKTMRDDRDESGALLPDHVRLSKFGKFLRSTSLDELPQLINVLKGDMSLIGPRPLLVEYLNIYNDIQIRRHDVRPGITGWAQVNGRNAISWGKKFELDLYYVNNISLMLDLKIFLLTLLKVLKSDGINSSDNVTMEKFNGNN